VVELVRGDRIGASAKLIVACIAVVFDDTRESVLITRRRDNGRWCLPSGRMEPGETVAEACARETLEETGLVVHVTGMVGVYSDPNIVNIYSDGNRYHVVRLAFRARLIGGKIATSDETSEVRFVSLSALDSLDVMEPHVLCIRDAIAKADAPVIA
jgi:ADP-ribose pyrophosphatase YjhB (NUDIX family)